MLVRTQGSSQTRQSQRQSHYDSLSNSKNTTPSYAESKKGYADHTRIAPPLSSSVARLTVPPHLPAAQARAPPAHGPPASPPAARRAAAPPPAAPAATTPAGRRKSTRAQVGQCCQSDRLAAPLTARHSRKQLAIPANSSSQQRTAHHNSKQLSATHLRFAARADALQLCELALGLLVVSLQYGCTVC